MKKPTSYFLVMLLALQAAAFYAQKPDRPKPRFTLTITGGNEDSYYKGMYGIAVIETNISNEVLREGVCMPATFEAGVRVSMVYNGMPMEMDETKPAVQYIRKQDKEGKGHCPGKIFLHVAQPGGGPEGAFEDNLDLSLLYDMSKPGTYEVTVSKQTFPHNPEKSVTVKSNTLTIVVPEPGDAAPE